MPFILDDENLLSPTHRTAGKGRFNVIHIPTAETRGWLKNADGAYLHFSGEACALEKAYRWQGTAEQANKLRQAHPFARKFRTLVPVAV